MDRVVAYLAAQQEALLTGSRSLAAGDRRGVHSSRVAVRRARSTLRTFGPCFAESALRPLDAALSAHAGRLGGVRDLEVLQGVLAEHATGALADWLDGRLEIELGEVWATVSQAVAAEQPDELPMRFAAALHSAADRSVSGGDLAKLARRARRRAKRRLARAGGDPESLHEARKAAKRARYAAEVLGDDERAERLTRIQDVLGEHNDLVVAGRWLAAAEVPSALRVDSAHLGARLEGAAADCLAKLPS